MNRILIVGDSSSIHIKKWADYFVKEGYEVAIATFSQQNITKVNKIKILSERKSNHTGGNYYYLLSISKLSHFIKEFKPNYINAHFSYSMGFVSLLALKLSGISASLSVVCHGSDILVVPNKIFNFVNKYVLKNCDRIFAVSQQITERLHFFKIPNEKIFTGQYGVETFESTNEKRFIDIISIRNYVENSRIDQILENFDNPFFYTKKIVFVLPNIQKQKLFLLRKRYDRITFYESLPHDSVLKILKQSKIYISATKSDGSSLSLIEALACGVYPIVSNIPANREWVVNSLNGVLFNSWFEFNEGVKKIIKMEENELDYYRKINSALVKQSGEYDEQMSKIIRFLQ